MQPNTVHDRLGHILPPVRLVRTPFPQAIETLARVSGTDIRIDWGASDSEDVNAIVAAKSSPVDANFPHATLEEALLAVIAAPRTRLTCREDGDHLTVTTDRSIPRVWRAYDVGDLIDQTIAEPYGWYPLLPK